MARRLARVSVLPPRAAPPRAATKSKRVQVMMEPAEFAALEQLARQSGSSVGELMRQAARAHLLGDAARERRAEASRAFLGLREERLPAWKDLKRELEDRRG